MTAKRELVTCLLSVEPAGDDAVGAVARLSAELDRMGRDAQILVLDHAGNVNPGDLKTGAGHTVERLRPTSDESPADLFRRAVKQAAGDWILRVPAAGLDFAFLVKLFARTRAGKVPADMVVGVRPSAGAGPLARFARGLNEWLLGLVFGVPVSDAGSPVALLRRNLLDENLPHAAGAFFGWELVARANFTGKLVDELPLLGAWTAGPPRSPGWFGIWRQANHLLHHPDFPVRPIAVGAPAPEPARKKKNRRG